MVLSQREHHWKLPEYFVSKLQKIDSGLRIKLKKRDQMKTINPQKYYYKPFAKTIHSQFNLMTIIAGGGEEPIVLSTIYKEKIKN